MMSSTKGNSGSFDKQPIQQVSFVGALLRAGIPFGVLMSLFFAWQTSWIEGVIRGSIAGILFGLMIAAFTLSRRVRSKATPNFRKGETVVLAGPANRFVKSIAHGGYLWLTTHRLVFRSHSYLQEHYEMSIPLEDILKAQVLLPFFPLPFITITRRTGERESFVVYKPRQWCETINAACLRKERSPNVPGK